MFPSKGSTISLFVWMRYHVIWVIESSARTRSEASTDELGPREVVVNSRHQTILKPALEMLLSTIAFMNDVVKKREEVKRTCEKNREELIAYQQASGRLSLEYHGWLVNEARSKRDV